MHGPAAAGGSPRYSPSRSDRQPICCVSPLAFRLPARDDLLSNPGGRPHQRPHRFLSRRARPGGLRDRPTRRKRCELVLCSELVDGARPASAGGRLLRPRWSNLAACWSSLYDARNRTPGARAERPSGSIRCLQLVRRRPANRPLSLAALHTGPSALDLVKPAATGLCSRPPPAARQEARHPRDPSCFRHPAAGCEPRAVSAGSGRSGPRASEAPASRRSGGPAGPGHAELDEMASLLTAGHCRDPAPATDSPPDQPRSVQFGPWHPRAARAVTGTRGPTRPG